VKYFIISGETSGDQHAAELIKEIRKRDSEALFIGMGGSASAAAGMKIIIDHGELSFMGFIEVARKIRKIRKALRTIKISLVTQNPDFLILVDYPGFNLRIARFAKKKSIPVHYYIAPKVWAWNEHRVKKIKAYVDMLYCILPFEQAYFTNKGVACKYVGNPSWYKIRQSNFSPESNPQGELMALLPGSRRQEIQSILPIMIECARNMNQKFAISKAPGISDSFYHQIAKPEDLVDDMYTLLRRSHTALVTSGTATLEAALLNVPQIVCYKTSKVSYRMAKWLITLPYISLVNIILNKHAVPEVIQDEFNSGHLSSELSKILSDSIERSAMLNEYRTLRNMLGDLNPGEEIAQVLVPS
jgi:lipid-A-disaccharide synthase